ncbi:MAG: hypothetical protein K8S55_00205 [Phycisphaerae bacterium]|nr:hypothetical protein [Phycisphaerae bacterium]
MKRIAFFLMIAAVSMSFVLVGCGKDKKSDTPDTDTKPEKAAPDKAAAEKAAPATDALKKAAPATDALKKAAPATDALKKAAPAKDAPKKAAPAKDAPKKAAPAKAVPEKAAPAKAAAGDKVKHGWTDTKIGDMVKYEMQNETTMTQTVTKITDEKVFLDMVMVMKTEALPAQTVDMPRYGEKKAKADNATTKKLPNETLKVGGKDLVCEVTETTITNGDKVTISKAWICKEVPGWIVRSDNNGTTIMKLVEYTKK